MNIRVSPQVRTQIGSSSARGDLASQLDGGLESAAFRMAKFGIGQVVKHRIYAFRGVIFDVDPVFANTEEWWLAIPAEVRPRKDQPFYHLLAENDEGGYVAYVSEQNLVADTSGEPVGNPNTRLIFDGFFEGQYHLRPRITH
jgi:heat shock protein HspQ